MIIDSSVICAIALKEPGWETYFDALLPAGACFMSAVSFLETCMVLESRRPGHGEQETRLLVDAFSIQITPFTEAEALKAFQGFLKYGKGRHKAGLNLGDCASYGASKVQGRPLLFKGEDFPQTDIDVAP